MIRTPTLRLWKPLLQANQTDRSSLATSFTETSVTYPPATFGASSGVVGSSSTTVIQNASFSFSVWLKRTTNIVNDYAYIVNNRANIAGNEAGLALMIRNSTNGHYLVIHYGLGPPDNDWLTTYVLPLNVAVHIGVVITATTTYLYVNGVLHSSVVDAAGALVTTVDIHIGRSIQNGQHFLGNIWDLQFHNFELNLTDIKRIMAGLHPLRRA